MEVDLTDGHFKGLKGVYIIWHDGIPPKIVRVGQGVIKERIEAHRRDDEIKAFSASGMMYVTWAKVTSSDRDGVENYLGVILEPRVGPVFPDCDPIEVDLPWEDFPY